MKVPESDAKQKQTVECFLTVTPNYFYLKYHKQPLMTLKVFDDYNGKEKSNQSFRFGARKRLDFADKKLFI